jgi:hypothetical protein
MLVSFLHVHVAVLALAMQDITEPCSSLVSCLVSHDVPFAFCTYTTDEFTSHEKNLDLKRLRFVQCNVQCRGNSKRQQDHLFYLLKNAWNKLQIHFPFYAIPC